MSRRWSIVLAEVGLAAMTTVAISETPASADPGDGVALNGAYTVVSDGEWAKKNETLFYQATVTARWILSSTCSNYQNCTGTVTSDQGWTADLEYLSGVWYVRRTLPNWEPCPDGSAFPGEQTYYFWPDRDDRAQLTGWDKTIGPSGACGINEWLTVKMPLRLTPG